MNKLDRNPADQADVVLVGAGIMSATPAVILKELDPYLADASYGSNQRRPQTGEQKHTC